MFWMKHPRTNEPDTMLTIAVAGFVFAVGIVTASLVYLFLHDKELTALTSVAVLVGAILTPSLAAYTARKYTDSKLSSGEGNEK